MPSPGSTPDNSAAATCPMAPPVAMGRSSVCERDCKDKSLNLILTVIVRAELEAPRSMVATESAMRSTWRSSSCASTRSWLKVSSCPIDLLGRFGLTGSGSSPRDSARQVGAARLAQATDQGVERERGQIAHRAHARDRAGASPSPDPHPTTPRRRARAGTPAHPPARRETRPGPARGRSGWPAAWPPARPAWRSFWSDRCRRRIPGEGRRAPVDAGRARCAPAARAGARRRRRQRMLRRDRSARPWESRRPGPCGARRSPRRTGCGGRTGRWPRGRAGGPAPTAWPSAPRRRAPRRCTRPPRPAPRPRPRSPASRPGRDRRALPPTRRTRPCRCAGWWGGSAAQAPRVNRRNPSA